MKTKQELRQELTTITDKMDEQISKIIECRAKLDIAHMEYESLLVDWAKKADLLLATILTESNTNE